MSFLARQLMGLMKTVNTGRPQQLWRFTASADWVLSASNTIAKLNSGALAAWLPILPSSKTRSVASGGKYYFEIRVNQVIVGNSNGPRFGVFDGSQYHLFMPRGAVAEGTEPHGTSTAANWHRYTDATLVANTVYKWNGGDTVGCSVEKSGSNTLIKFYINGMDAAYVGKPELLIAGTPTLGIALAGYRIASANVIDLQILDLKYLPAGFEPW
ncbi:hypothetical protein ADP71_31910 [Vitreoscilla sp. C1]|uniref:hypothetical protein n=1 Tax=Vitreoscilla sp. (strain C1) TaxID=96942 RepID=UPI000CDC356A|nr:hypothetical protein [Vitreoscilla sp. C1]AUZ06369.1 hypothetical protein ADP71_31910 [Vitreoscilla sp. C1]